MCILTENGGGGLWVLPWEETLCCPAAQPHLPPLLLSLYVEHLHCQNYNKVPEINENVLFNKKFSWKLHFSFFPICSPSPCPRPWILQLNGMVEECYIDVPIGKDFKIVSVDFQIILWSPVFAHAVFGSRADRSPYSCLGARTAARLLIGIIIYYLWMLTVHFCGWVLPMLIDIHKWKRSALLTT